MIPLFCFFLFVFSPFLTVECATYTFIKRLGRGEEGIVYLAHDSALGDVAIKHLIHKKPFLKAYALDHRNIIKIHEVYSENDSLFIVMDYVRGQTIDHIPYHSLERQQCLRLIYSLIQILKYAWDEGFVYEDLHVGNLMLNDEGQLILIDLEGFREREEKDGMNLESNGKRLSETIVEILKCGL